MTAGTTNTAPSTDYEFRRAVTDLLREELERRRMGPDELAEATGMLPSGAIALLGRRAWSLERAMLVANALGIRIEPRAEPIR